MKDLVESIPLGIGLVDREGRITHANGPLRDWFRRLPENAALADAPLAPCVACGERCVALCSALREHAATRDRRPLTRRIPIDGGRVLEARCEPLPEGHATGDGFVLVVEDVTGRLRDEVALEDANARLAALLEERSRELVYNREFLRSLIETNRDLLLSADSTGVITFTSAGFIGAAAGGLVGKPLCELVTEPLRDEFARQWRAVLAGDVPHVLFEGEGAGVLRDRWCVISLGPLRSGGAVNGLTAIISDLTSLREAWERVRSNEKMVATGRMAARIAHEINNPLTGISGAIQLIKADLPAGSPSARYAAMVEREIGRISNIVRQMYGLYRPEQEAARVVDLRPLVEDIVTLMRVDAGLKRVALVSLLNGPEPARVQEQNLRQVLLNVIRNAIEVTPADGRIELSVERHRRCVDLVVRDQGPGITDELRQQMFEPFFTTKSSSGGRGLGLGLSISDTLVKAMGGTISFENAPAGGARCKVCLPDADAPG